MSIRSIRSVEGGESHASYSEEDPTGTTGFSDTARDFYIGSSPALRMPHDLTVTHCPISVAVTPEEETWLKANPLRPAASFDGSGTVKIKLYAPNTTAEAFLDNLTPYETYKYSENVEICFGFTAMGEDGLSHEYQFTAVRNHGFFPTITRVTRDTDASSDGVVGVSWDLVPEMEAEAIVRSAAFQSKLRGVMPDAGVTEPFGEYLGEILDNLGQVSAVSGHQQFNAKTRIHTYAQHVELADWFKRSLSNILGSGAIIGAALKVAYRVLGATELAGGKGIYGQEVTAMDGNTYQAGK